jgi:sugar O-acyltransferase (sialic acid O-acetyltransferase NeuD family)
VPLKNISMKEIVIIGAGGFGREVKTLIDAINNLKFEYKLIGFYDDNIKVGTQINGLEVLGNVNDLNSVNSNLYVAIGIGVPKIKEQIILRLKNSNLLFPNLIHPSVIISEDDVSFGVGNVICAGNIITCNIKIKNFITLNLCCTVGHDTIINNYCSFMPNVNISGEVTIMNNVYVGTGAKIINNLKIGENTIVGAGAVVSKNLPENCTAVGIPAKPIKFH